MIISFDLDGTLTPLNKDEFPTEDRSLIQKLFGVELIRKGSRNLFKELRKGDHEIGIYTTSFRSTISIKFQLLTYGILVDFIINEELNRKELASRGLSCSKYPPAFNIDLHIDDLRGVEIEGEKFNFNTILILNDDSNWTEKVLEICANKK